MPFEDHARRAEPAAPCAVRYDAVVSFVLYNTDLAEVRNAVRQVLASPGRHHVVLIDNSEPSLDLAGMASADVTVVSVGKNIGYGAGHNIALRRFAQAARYQFVLNTDLEFGPEVIPGMIAFLDQRPDVGMAMPQVRYPDGNRQYLCRILPRPIDIFARGLLPDHRWSRALSRRYEAHGWSHDESISFPFLSGCFMAIRPAALARAGLFDERFFLFAEDLDLSRRLHRISKTVLCPSVIVVHEYRTKTSSNRRRKLYLVRSFIKYFNKYGWFFDRERREMNRRTLARLDKPGRPDVAGSNPR